MSNSLNIVKKLMLERSVEVEVACSVKQVYDLWENLENVPQWMPLVKSVRRLLGDEQNGKRRKIPPSQTSS